MHKVEQQSYKSCALLMRLAAHYGTERLENACSRVLNYTPNPSFKNISTILKNGQDKVGLANVLANTSSKVKFKSHKVHNTQIKDRTVFIGRTYANFKISYLDEMDTVQSAKGSNKCIPTFYFLETELFLAYLLSQCTPSTVRIVFDRLQSRFGSAFDFSCLFPVIPTDRGVEFGNSGALEPPGQVSIIATRCGAIRKTVLKIYTP
ncbi:MAG: hypothetical protein NC089_01685 [Bacteroides sp.]|nr:hypothetical protein [Bacteroides sp.]MCM1548834.1 hypothetical protein [Clostridium sp.]